ncbi:hypothetical protein [Brachybacterium sp. GPGPB12]|uniref:hypothetical protein n=1 Tax=Brachybacterium sp. GPGPB12 TaxID=3023517 RepID=UPI0031343B78
MLITVTGRMVRSHGVGEVALPESGRITLTPLSHGVWDGALRGRDSVVMRVTDGVAVPVDLTPGPWRVRVEPEHGPAWDSWQVELVPGMAEPVDLADLAPVVVIDGEKWATGPAGASVTGGRDNGDGTVSFELSDGTYTDPVTVPPGPAGRGIASISDPDADSRVTITFTDDTTATVQAIRGAPGEKGDPGKPGADSTVPGPANTLSIGTVTTGATGSAASATITGTAPAQTLNLTLPRGEQGTPGTATLPDTGWRNVTAHLRPPVTGGTVLVRRIGNTVTWRFVNISTSGMGDILTDPNVMGTFAAESAAVWPPRYAATPIPVWVHGQATGAPSWITAARSTRYSAGFLSVPGAMSNLHGEGSYLSDRPFPVGDLPGTPA